ncbi:hypothetical protein FQN52_000971 [Onygenales sp. PD_12]|nr:hypothetical protein FQN52_000971 [Onygenales sp. PD_12]
MSGLHFETALQHEQLYRSGLEMITRYRMVIDGDVPDCEYWGKLTRPNFKMKSGSASTPFMAPYRIIEFFKETKTDYNDMFTRRIIYRADTSSPLRDPVADYLLCPQSQTLFLRRLMPECHVIAPTVARNDGPSRVYRAPDLLRALEDISADKNETPNCRTVYEIKYCIITDITDNSTRSAFFKAKLELGNKRTDVTHCVIDAKAGPNARVVFIMLLGTPIVQSVYRFIVENHRKMRNADIVRISFKYESIRDMLDIMLELGRDRPYSAQCNAPSEGKGS